MGTAMIATTTRSVTTNTGNVCTRMRMTKGDEDLHISLGFEYRSDQAVSFVYTSDKPFNPARLARQLELPWEGLLRSKGFFWLATRNDIRGLWQTAGQSWSGEFRYVSESFMDWFPHMP
eukprot:scaffold572755_cov48-Prasinocladus_malaysianus.AAC.1